MTSPTSSPTAPAVPTPRQLAAIALDLEDRQQHLVEELWHLSEGLVNRVQVPEGVRQHPELLRSPWSEQFAGRFQGLVLELRRTLLAVTALQHDRYGRCRHCAEPIPAAMLLEDVLCDHCSNCSAGGGPGQL